jgi:hypothetical protein
VSPNLHHALFVLLPLVLAGAVVLRRGGDAVTRGHASMRLCLGVGKWVLLVVPLWRIAMLVLENGPQNVSGGAAWAGLLSVSVCLGLLFTCAGDISAGLGGWLGVPTPPLFERALTVKRKSLLLLVLAAIGVMLAVTRSPVQTALFLKALVVPPVRSYAVLFQEMRVWTDLHILTLIAGAAVFFLAPPSASFLTIWRPWKGWWCLGVLLLAIVMLWTQISPM